MQTSFRSAAAIVFLVFPVLMAGCSGGSEESDTVVVKGTLLDNGNPFVFDESKMKLPEGATAPPPGSSGLRIVFMLIETKEQFQAKYNPEKSTFEVKGAKGKGIKPGLYKVAITANYAPTGKSSQNNDYFDSKFSLEKTQIKVEVKAGQDITIDLAKPKG